jgi:cytokinesis protein
MILHCDFSVLDNEGAMEFLQSKDMCTIPENTAKLMAPYSKDWTGPKAISSTREQDPSELTRQDQLYLYTAFELHHYWKARMRALHMTRHFESDYDEIAAKLKEIGTISNAIRDSVTLLNVLSFILLVGNFMNDPNKQAHGFKISSLARLGMVKDLNNETTLLDFVERMVRNKWSEWDNFTDDIAGVVNAKKINVDQLIQDSKNYISNINNVQSSLDAGNLSDPKKFHPKDRVSVVTQRVMKDARRKAEQLGLYLEETTSTYNEIMTFFGEDPLDENSRRTFFASFADFLTEWKRSREKNMSSEETRRRNEASMKRKQAAIGSPLSSTGGADTPPSPGPSSGAMDDLLAKLRAAKPETRDRRDRRRIARLKDRHAVRVASGQKMPELHVGTAGTTDTGLLSPASENSETGSGSGSGDKLDPTTVGPTGGLSDAELDIADRAASLLQDMGGVSDDARDEEKADKVRKRSAAEEERNRRRARRQQARSEISVASQPITDDGEDPDRTIVPRSPERSPERRGSVARSPTKSPAKKAFIPPVTIVSPPSPKMEAEDE